MEFKSLLLVFSIPFQACLLRTEPKEYVHWITVILDGTGPLSVPTWNVTENRDLVLAHSGYSGPTQTALFA